MQINAAIFAPSLWVVVLSLGCQPAVSNFTECEDVAGLHAICGVDRAEDLALLPNQSEVIMGEGYGVKGQKSGHLSILDPATETLVTVYEVDSGPFNTSSNSDWGASQCPGPPALSFRPHGIDLSVQEDGKIRLLVVNHGEQERVEFFEVIEKTQGTETAVEWRGCAVPPEGAFLNDVVSLPDGGFLVTHMMSAEAGAMDLARGSLGLETGFVYRWKPEVGFSRVPGTGGPLPNGIEVSDDGRIVYLNLYLGDELRVLELESGETLKTLEISRPDNLTWSLDGRLWVASHEDAWMDSMACMEVREGACGMGFRVVSVDPVSYEMQTLFAHEGKPMGAGTAALDLDGEMLIGSFASDRLLRVPGHLMNDSEGRAGGSQRLE